MPEKETKKKRSTFRKIVNGFLFFFIGIFILIILVVGFSQTAAFRNILREKSLAIINESLNGKINFEKINGTLFTSLSVYNATITLDKDTLLYANKISVKYNPLQLLFSTIYVREVNLENVRLNLVKDSLGVYNISKLSKPTPPDTTTSEFPFKIDVNNLNIKNTSIRLASYDRMDSDSLYSLYNMDDLRIDSLNLSLNALIDIAGNNFHAAITRFQFKPNLTDFRLNDLRGDFALTDSYARINNFHLRSNTTDMDLNISLEKVNLFKNFSIAKLKNSPVKVNLNARVFDFTDLNSAITSTDFMKGTFKAKLDLSGTYGNLNINQLDLDYLNTHLEATGKLVNLQEPEELFITAHLHDSYLNQSDIAELMPDMQLPVYKDVLLKNIIADFEGKPQNFLTALSAELNDGSFKTKGTFDFTGEEMKYDVNFETSSLNLMPVIGSPTLLNLNATAKGTGTDLSKMNTSAVINLRNTRYDEYFIDSLNLNAKAEAGIITADLLTLARGAVARLNAGLNLNNPEIPLYNLKGSINNLNLDRFMSDTTLVTDLNLNFAINGKNFDLNKIEADINLALLNSTYQKIRIDTTEFTLNIGNLPNNEKLIDFNSEFARLQIAGAFTPGDAISLVSYESDIITRSVLKKIYDFNPWALVKDTVEAREFQKRITIDTKIPDLVKTNIDLNYNLTIKDFDLIASMAGMKKLDLNGRITGGISNNDSLFSASTVIDLKHVNLTSDSSQTYVKNLNFELKVKRENTNVEFENISAEAKLKTDRVFSGSDIKNIFVYFDLHNNLFSYDLAADVDTTINAAIAGEVDMVKQQYDITVTDFLVNYLGYKWTNDSSWNAHYSKDSLVIERISMVRNGSRIYLNGSLHSDGKEKLSFKIRNLDAELINKLAGTQNMLAADMDAAVNLNGYLHAPIIDASLTLNNISIDNRDLGFINVDLAYKDKLLKTEAVVLDSTLNQDNPELLLTGTVPIDLGFVGVKDRFIKGKSIDLSLLSQGFELSILRGFLPFVDGLTGQLITDLKIQGDIDNLNYEGSLKLNDVGFIIKQNNLPYQLGLKLGLGKNTVTIDSLSLANTGGTEYDGRMTGNGKINFKDKTFELDNINMALNGDLTILSSMRTPSIPYITGNLTLQSDGDWVYSYNNNSSAFNGKVLLTQNPALTIIPEQSAYAGDQGYNYVYIDSISVDSLINGDAKEVVRLSEKYNPLNRRTVKSKTAESSFDYNISVSVDDRATITFVLDRTTNARLIAILNGSMLYKSNGIAQGEFELLEGSQLNFFKEFDATGNIYFESDPTNPRLDVIASYVGRYRDSVDVAVKIKLTGQVSELGRNLSEDQSNSIGIYVGEENISNNTPSPEYDAADAISFILAGKFVEDLTEGDRARAANDLNDNSPYTGYAESALSGLVSGFANSQLGNYIESIRLQNLTTGDTKVMLAGRAKNVTYNFGVGLGQNANATFNVEYNLIENLSIKLERKDPVIELSNPNVKIHEVGLKYKFIF